MSRPNNWFYGPVRVAIAHYRDIQASKSAQAEIFRAAILMARAETAAHINGELKLQIIDAVLFRQALNYDGAALRFYVSASSAKKYCNAFVNLVALYAGFV